MGSVSLAKKSHSEAKQGSQPYNRKLKSKYIGVSFRKNCPWKPWKAIITMAGHIYWLGGFEIQEEAARAYDEAALELYGEKAITNNKRYGDNDVQGQE